MSLDATTILDGLTSHALALGLFERVNSHEPKNAPGNGLTAAVWVDSIAPVPTGSGLASTSARLVFNVRIYTGAEQEPADAIDPNMLAATDALMSAYSGDFTLGGSVRNVDLLGQAGTSLSAQAGYIQHDSKLLRVMTLVVPVIVNDVWEQVP
ncbi:hypothetical protein OG884_15505 [Streptosporangium sp. NBC_01755]|uniref:hypothetical protein n=1 Tax=Streptosporangium sp. NBC_01755 TaxID=2975949 RepID=UPI002DD904C9|nr:hypothetical protein [Streptosporangium sp. NBC_01755]WSD03240.1 hypothetical protein OG884_15505 [Streptosporangium sp. NBC_01755]